MIKLLINGICGKMGTEVAKLCAKDTDIELMGGLDRYPNCSLPYTVFNDIHSLLESPNVIIDFSTPEAT